MAALPLTTAEYIGDGDTLRSLVEWLKNESLIAVDTESNSLYAYQEQVCLIQFSTRSADFIIDPLTIDDLSAFGQLMANDNIEKVFHAAEYDITCMKRDFGFEFRNIFDTMIAARICGLEAYGLGAILDTYFGIAVDKSHQLDNWGARPLGDESLAYAQMDTHFLPYLRDELYRELQRQGRLAESREAFEEVTYVPAAALRVFDVNGFWKLSRSRALTPLQLRILRELYHLREDLARQEWKPPFKVISNRVLVALALDGPKSIKALQNTGLLNDNQLDTYGKAVVAAIRRGKKSKHTPVPPEPEPLDPDITERYAALHLWRKERALQRGVESDVIISKQILWNLAQQVPRSVEDLHDIEGIGPWRMQTYGQEIIDVLNRY